MGVPLRDLAARVGGEVEGDGGLVIEGVAALEQAGPAHVSFLSNKKYREAFLASKAGAVLVEPGEEVPPGRTVVRAPNAYLAFAKLQTFFHPPPASVPGVAPGASVHPTAKVDPTAQVYPLASVGPGAVVGPRTILHPGVQLGADVRVGADCLLYANVVVREQCVLGDRVILQPGCVIGSDGFGYALDLEGEGKGPRHFKIPQAGNVVVEDDVEIGANSTVDRAALGSTRIGRGAKIDNLVQIAHNVQIGPLCIIASQAGISGSTKLGMGVAVWGQAGIVGHVTIGDRANIAAQAGVQGDLEPGARVAGSPSSPDVTWARNAAVFNRLTEMRRELRALQKQVAALGGAPGDEPKPASDASKEKP
ncbi:MAG: UDP-3-O-(3-hydroxymyristoyl)glucosamine N-acyltransferase [Anaeromyxobacter sp.]